MDDESRSKVGGLKRKFEVGPSMIEKKILIFVNSDLTSKYAAGLYEFKIKIPLRHNLTPTTTTTDTTTSSVYFNDYGWCFYGKPPQEPPRLQLDEKANSVVDAADEPNTTRYEDDDDDDVDDDDSYDKLNSAFSKDISDSLQTSKTVPKQTLDYIYKLICEHYDRYGHGKGVEEPHIPQHIPPTSVAKGAILESLQLVQTFYYQSFGPTIYSVAACLCGNILYMIPHDMDKYPRLELPNPNRADPLSFDLQTKRMALCPPLQGKKSRPIATAAVCDNNKIFALSTLRDKSVPEPSFECFDPMEDFRKGGGWRKLPCSPVHNIIPEDNDRGGVITGYALLDDNFILVSFYKRQEDIMFYSYNIKCQKWDDVTIDDGSKLPYMDGEAVVVGRDIYIYQARCRKLFVFSYDVKNRELLGGSAESSSSFVLSLAEPSVVEGLKFNEYPETFEEDDNSVNNGESLGSFFSSLAEPSVVEGLKLNEYPETIEKDEYFESSFGNYEGSGAIAKVDDGIFCLLHTLGHIYSQDKHVCVTIVRLDDKRDCCTTLMSFTSALEVGHMLCSPVIKSCYARAV